MIKLRADSPIITIIGVGSSNSFTNGAPIVIVLETRTTIFIAVVFLSNGNILSSQKAVWYTAVNPTCIDRDMKKRAMGIETFTRVLSSSGLSLFITFC